MKEFMIRDFEISEIVLCAEVKNGTPIHKNRKSHGLVFYPYENTVFNFEKFGSIKSVENSVIYLPKGSNYTVSSKNPTRCYAINFQLADSETFSPFCVKIKNHADVLKLFCEADKVYMKADAGYKMKCKSLLYDIISHLQYEYSLGYISGEKQNIISEAVKKIHDCYTDENLKISELAALCGITPEYFRNIFGKVYGVSPSKYIATLKISRAKELLSSGMYSVSETAHMCGFEDTGYFSRSFKKIIGVSPSEYRG